jgi:hypothetical protein
MDGKEAGAREGRGKKEVYGEKRKPLTGLTRLTGRKPAE